MRAKLNSLGNFVENQLTITVEVYFWTLNSIPLICESILLRVSDWFDYCSFISFEIRKDKPSNLILFKDYYRYSGLFAFSHKCYDEMLFSGGKEKGENLLDFDRDWIDSLINFGRTTVLVVIVFYCVNMRFFSIHLDLYLSNVL